MQNDLVVQFKIKIEALSKIVEKLSLNNPRRKKALEKIGEMKRQIRLYKNEGKKYSIQSEQPYTMHPLSRLDVWEKLEKNHAIVATHKEIFAALKRYSLSVPAKLDITLPVCVLLEKALHIEAAYTLVQELHVLFANTARQNTKQTEDEEEILLSVNLMLSDELTTLSTALLWRVRPTLRSQSITYLYNPYGYVVERLQEMGINELPSVNAKRRPESYLTPQHFNSLMDVVIRLNNGRHFIDSADSTIRSTTDPAEFVWVQEKQSNYIMYLPTEFSSYVVLKPPRFPSINKGEAARHQFFKENSIHFMEMRGLTQIVDDVAATVSNAISPTEIRQLMSAIQRMPEVVEEHDRGMQTCFIENTWFNRLFRSTTLEFQRKMHSTHVAAKIQMAEKQLQGVSILVKATYLAKINHLVLGKPVEVGIAAESETFLQEKLDDLAKNPLIKKDGLKHLSNLLSDIQKVPESQFASLPEPSQLKDTTAQLIQQGKLDLLANSIRLAVSSARHAIEIPAEILKDLYNYFDVNLTTLYADSQSDNKKLDQMSDVLFQVDEFCSKSQDKTLISLEARWSECRKNHLSEKSEKPKETAYKVACQEYEIVVAQVIHKIITVVNGYLDNDEWCWPLSVSDMKEITKRSDGIFKDILMAQSSDLINNLDMLIEDIGESNTKVSDDVTAIRSLLNGDFPSFNKHVKNNVATLWRKVPAVVTDERITNVTHPSR